MGMMDKFNDAKEKAEELATEHGDKADMAIDKGADLIKSKTSDDTDEKIDMAGDKIKGVIDGLDQDK